MIARSFAIAVLLSVAACGQSAPHPYPAEAKTRFDQSCPPDSAVCTCTWDGITRSVAYEDYEAALQHFRETGNMDPRITRARTSCLERHPGG
jgi:predicted small lipoprotein YifL